MSQQPRNRCRRCQPVPEEVRQAADLLGRRSMLTILYASYTGAVRFNEFRQVLGPVPVRTLVARLNEAEAEGLLERVVVASRPPRVEYRLTERGLRLGAVMEALSRWAAEARTP